MALRNPPCQGDLLFSFPPDKGGNTKGGCSIAPLTESVSKLGFEVVAASFSLRKLLKFNVTFSQAEACGYKNQGFETPSFKEGIKGRWSTDEAD